MHLSKASIPGVIILRGYQWETKDAFSVEEARKKFCNLAIDTLDRDGGYMISECEERCRQKCSKVISLSNKWY